jgi:hypothetical protein
MTVFCRAGRQGSFPIDVIQLIVAVAGGAVTLKPFELVSGSINVCFAICLTKAYS